METYERLARQVLTYQDKSALLHGDYEVLCKVRDGWEPSAEKDRFCAALSDQLVARADYYELLQYQPGDYSRALLKALEPDV